MGTSSYIDVSNHRNSLLKLIRLWAQNCCSSISILLTVLAGQHDGLRKKIEVKEAYQRKHMQTATEILRSNNEIFFRRLQYLQKYAYFENADMENFVKKIILKRIFR